MYINKALDVRFLFRFVKAQCQWLFRKQKQKLKVTIRGSHCYYIKFKDFKVQRYNKLYKICILSSIVVRKFVQHILHLYILADEGSILNVMIRCFAGEYSPPCLAAGARLQ